MLSIVKGSPCGDSPSRSPLPDVCSPKFRNGRVARAEIPVINATIFKDYTHYIIKENKIF